MIETIPEKGALSGAVFFLGPLSFFFGGGRRGGGEEERRRGFETCVLHSGVSCSLKFEAELSLLEYKY